MAALVVGAVVLPGCTLSRIDPARDDRPACPGLTIEAEPVRGDVNTTFLRAVVREHGAPKAVSDVEFRAPEADGRSYSVFSATPSGPDGVAEVDLAAVLLTDPHLAGVARRATTMQVVHVATLAPGKACVTRATAAFEPSVREVVRPSGLVRTRAELLALLREIGAALPAPGRPGVARLADGSGACRALYGLVEDSEVKGLYPAANEDLRDAAGLCARSPQLAGLHIRRVLT